MGFEYSKGSRSLPDLFGEKTQRSTQRAAQRLARAGGQRMTTLAKANAPEDTGELRDSYETKLVRQVSTPVGDVYESGVQSDYYVARFIEMGAKEHLIGPEAQSFIDGSGGRVFAREVHHPGIRPTYPVANAAAQVEAEMTELAWPTLTRWARAIERGSGD